MFGLPKLSASFNQFIPTLIPFLIPILQTCLTVSVYSTVAIAVNGIFIVHPLNEGKLRNWIKFRQINVAALASLGITVFSVVFNISR